MFKVIGMLIKFVCLAVFVLVLGNWIKWDGRTLSDQVKVRMSHAERSDLYGEVRDWTQKITYDARKGTGKNVNPALPVVPTEEFAASERQKLKALIQELNSSHKKD